MIKKQKSVILKRNRCSPQSNRSRIFTASSKMSKFSSAVHDVDETMHLVIALLRYSHLDFKCTEFGWSISTSIVLTPRALFKCCFMALLTHKCLSASRPSLYSAALYIFTAKLRSPQRSAAMEYPRLCQSMTSRQLKSLQKSMARKLEIIGGFWMIKVFLAPKCSK